MQENCTNLRSSKVHDSAINSARGTHTLELSDSRKVFPATGGAHAYLVARSVAQLGTLCGTVIQLLLLISNPQPPG